MADADSLECKKWHFSVHLGILMCILQTPNIKQFISTNGLSFVALFGKFWARHECHFGRSPRVLWPTARRGNARGQADRSREVLAVLRSHRLTAS